ncbi:hypothetical protein BDZ85DRAFT_249567 [Elsinoe ampelina]|uniref:Uncharacterized protein n=1 Tax=Elsinoe ampelina TaxID=302913 RepID=A0A6A6GD65_9PEZI|nr:hypothetical protein BDZ85DRAFT_249567 [Elsinoe ampelina]
MLPLSRIICRSSRATPQLLASRTAPPFPHFQIRHAARVSKKDSGATPALEPPSSPTPAKRTRAKSTASTPKTLRASTKKAAEKAVKAKDDLSDAILVTAPAKTTKRAASTSTKPAKAAKEPKEPKESKEPKIPPKATRAKAAPKSDTKTKSTRVSRKAKIEDDEAVKANTGVAAASTIQTAPHVGTADDSINEVAITPESSTPGEVGSVSSADPTESSVVATALDSGASKKSYTTSHSMDPLRSAIPPVQSEQEIPARNAGPEEADTLPIASSAAPPASPDTVLVPPPPPEEAVVPSTSSSLHAGNENHSPMPAPLSSSVAPPSSPDVELALEPQSSVEGVAPSTTSAAAAAPSSSASQDRVGESATSMQTATSRLPPGQPGGSRSPPARTTIMNKDTGFEFYDARRGRW